MGYNRIKPIAIHRCRARERILHDVPLAWKGSAPEGCSWVASIDHKQPWKAITLKTRGIR